MALKSGLAAQIGFADETTAGTPVAPSLFLPLVEESITLDLERLESDAIIAGRRVLDSDMWNGGNATVAGDIGLELYNRSLTKLFKHMFGAVVTTGPGPYTHTFTPGDLDDDSLTVQVGRPGVGGTVHPFTYAGIKVASWELACSVGEIATLGLSVVGMGEQAGSRVVTDGVLNETTTLTSATAVFSNADKGKRVSATGITAGTYIASVTNATTVVLSAAATATATGVSVTIGTALGSATLAAGLRPLKFNHGTISIGGTTANVKAVTLSGDNGLATDRRFIGSQFISTPLEAELRTYDGSVDVEFVDLTQTNRFLNGEEFAMVLGFTAGADSVTITTNSRFDGAAANVAGRGILEQSLPIKNIGDTDAEAITAVLVNSDSTA